MDWDYSLAGIYEEPQIETDIQKQDKNHDLVLLVFKKLYFK